MPPDLAVPISVREQMNPCISNQQRILLRSSSDYTWHDDRDHDGPGPASRNSMDETDVYTALAARRTAFDTLMWQIPTIGLAAQAFLLTIALGAGSSRWARMVAGSLALVTALVAMQTMAKHRANERTDSLILERLEERLRIRVSGVSPHARPADRATAMGNRLRRWLGLRSFDLWIGSLLFFTLAGSSMMG